MRDERGPARYVMLMVNRRGEGACFSRGGRGPENLDLMRQLKRRLFLCLLGLPWPCL